MPTTTNLDQLTVDTIRFLAVDAVEAANSGHPGLPLGASPMAYALFSDILRFNPKNETWFNRDRFVLSAGHGSAMLYALLHVFGYNVDIEDLKQFRQWDSCTPGHPEFGETSGVEATTGPLGQGFGNAVGMAIAEKWMAARYNVDGINVVDYHIYALASDGDLMEGVCQEAASLAGHLKLNNLTVLYDSNHVSLDGPTDFSYTDNVAGIFEARGWNVTKIADGNDIAAIREALEKSKSSDKPTLIEVTTVIGYGSPKAGTSATHGAALGPEATKATKEALGWPTDKPFYVPDEVEGVAAQATEKGRQLQGEWEAEMGRLKEMNPAVYDELMLLVEEKLPDDWQEELDKVTFTGKVATRNAGKSALNALAKKLPWIIGGAADLTSSTKTIIDDSPHFSPADRSGRNIFFGVREHGMGTVVNGLCYSGLMGFGSTFLVFSDYMRGSIRLAALTELPSLFIFSHDSVFVGEDGPTHEPIEHVMSLRLMPGLDVYRPGDAYETLEAFRSFCEYPHPAAILLTRQDLPVMSDKVDIIREGAPMGGYTLVDTEGEPHVVMIATGSEVCFAVEVAGLLSSEYEIEARVVSLPCWELFLSQDQDYIDSVLPPSIPRVSLEAGVTMGWERLVGLDGLSIGIDEYGASAPGEKVYAERGFVPESVAEQIAEFLQA